MNITKAMKNWWEAHPDFVVHYTQACGYSAREVVAFELRKAMEAEAKKGLAILEELNRG